jgi:hypothetical protein
MTTIRGPVRRIAAGGNLLAAMLLLAGCGSSAASPAPSTAAAASQAPTGAGGGASQPAAEPTDVATTDPGASVGGGPIGGDIGDRSKGSAQAQISGGLTASVDLPYAPVLARLMLDGPNTAYLPFTDTTNGTLFLTITDAGLLVQYAGPDQVGITSGGTPCEFHLDTLDAKNAKGTFTCKGMLLVKADGGVGSADMTGSFEGHQ